MNKLLRFAIAFEKARAFLFIYVILVRSMYGDWWGEKKPSVTLLNNMLRSVLERWLLAPAANSGGIRA